MDAREAVELWEAVQAPGPRPHRLACVRRLRAALDAAEAAIVAEEAAASSLPEPVIADAAGTGWRDAERLVQRAELLGQAPELTDALSRGAITAGHVDAIGRGLRSLEPAEQRSFLERVPTLAASAAHTPTDRFVRTVAAAVRQVRAESGIDLLARQVRDIRLSLRQDPLTEMWRLSATLDPANGALLRERLDTVAKGLDAGDEAPTDPLERGSWIQARALMVLTDRGASGIRPTCVIDRRGSKPVYDWGADVVLPDELSELVCRFARPLAIEIGPSGEIRAPGRLDWGRERRHATAEQRRVLRALYPTCAVPGCPVRFHRLDIHHVIEWIAGGRTDLANLLPLCPHHHALVHDEGWKLALRSDRTLTIELPDGTVMTTGPPVREAG